MKSAENWVEAFNISPENMTAWSTEVPAGQPLLAWAIQEHKVDLSDYLNWASEHFGLPVLDSAFFTSGFELQLSPEERELGKWSPWMFPVATWDDVTLVACCEPPAESLEGVYAYVLADPQILHSQWQQGEPKPILDAPLGVDLNSAKKYKLDLGSLGLEPEPEVFEAPTEPTISAPPAPTAPTTPVRTPKSNSPPPSSAPATAPQPTWVRRADLVSLPASVEAVIETAFQSLKKDYVSALLLKKEGSVAKALRWDSSLETEVNPAKIAVDLNFPSFLRIVTKTMQPYHGYVIDSPMHQDFFANLNLKSPPPCVTALPIKLDGALWGIVVAIGLDSALAPEVLYRASVAIEKLSEALEPSLTGTQAA